MAPGIVQAGWFFGALQLLKQLTSVLVGKLSNLYVPYVFP